jgi:hypothetical protein
LNSNFDEHARAGNSRGFACLSSEQAARRLAVDGQNAVPGSEPRSLIRIAARVLLVFNAEPPAVGYGPAPAPTRGFALRAAQSVVVTAAGIRRRGHSADRLLGRGLARLIRHHRPDNGLPRSCRRCALDGACSSRISNAATTAEGNRWLPRLALTVSGVLVLLLAFPWVRQILGFGLPAASQLGCY